MTDSGPTVHARVAQALRVVRAAVLGQDFERPWEPGLASEWLAESYYQQSQANRRSPSREAAWEQARYRGRRTGLERALVAAQQARAVRGRGLQLRGGAGGGAGVQLRRDAEGGGGD